jgi:hypothetical protein
MNMDPNDGEKINPTPKYSLVVGAELSGPGFCKPFTSVVLIQKVRTFFCLLYSHRKGFGTGTVPCKSTLATGNR